MASSHKTTTARALPPACDQCRKRKVKCRREQPVCSNCVRSGLVCNFNAHVKRVNHTKQLAQDFTHLSGRLERIDDTLLKINQKLDQPSGSVAYTSSASAYSDDHVDRLPTDDWQGSTVPIESTEDDIHLHTVDENGIESYYGPTSLLALMQRTRHAVRRIVISTQYTSAVTAVPDALHMVDQGFPSPSPNTGRRKEPIQAIIKIPYTLALPAMGTFLTTYNVQHPIIDGDRFGRTVASYYDDVDAQDEAVDLCLSAMAIMSIGTQSAVGQDLAAATLETLLANCCRYAERVLQDRPRLLNVQALILSYHVLSQHSFETEAAQALRKALNLMQDLCIEHDTQNQEDREKRMTYWHLSSIDKQRAFLTGKACRLHLQDCGLSIPWTTAEGSETAIYAARAHLFMLYEDIWSAFYSAHAFRSAPQERARQVLHMDARLTTWYERHKDHLRGVRARASMAQSITAAKMELQYCKTQVSVQTRINSARAMLRIITELSADGSHLSAALCRSPVAFFDLHYSLLHRTDDHVAHDLALLYQVYVDVQSQGQQHAHEPGIHDHLATSMHWCLSVNKVVAFSRGGQLPFLLDDIPPRIPVSYQSREGKRPAAEVPDVGPDEATVASSASDFDAAMPWAINLPVQAGANPDLGLMQLGVEGWYSQYQATSVPASLVFNSDLTSVQNSPFPELPVAGEMLFRGAVDTLQAPAREAEIEEQ